jgi:hypothetical protein
LQNGVVDRLRHRVNLNRVVFVLLKLARNPITKAAKACGRPELRSDKDLATLSAAVREQRAEQLTQIVLFFGHAYLA